MNVYLDPDGRHWIAEAGGKRVPSVTFETEAEAWEFLFQLASDPAAAALFDVELELQNVRVH